MDSKSWVPFLTTVALASMPHGMIKQAAHESREVIPNHIQEEIKKRAQAKRARKKARNKSLARKTL